MIELRTLGTVDLRDRESDRDLTPTVLQSKRLALLVYLAVARPRGFHSRDTLMSLFWPEQGSARARNSLRQALFFLRSTLGPEVVAGRGKGDVGLAADALWCDAVGFDHAVESHDYPRAVELYRGDFLAGFHAGDSSPEFEWWLDRERGRMRRAVVGALRALADRQQAAGKPQAAVGLVRRAVLIDPDDEQSVRLLIALLGTLGDRAGAIQVYQQFHGRTLEEYGVGASPETEAVLRRVCEREEVGFESPVQPPPPTTIPSPPTPLVAREREIRTAIGLLQRPDTQLLTFTGPGGCGKSRLAIEVASRWARESQEPVYFVPLASTRASRLVMPALARVLGAPKGAKALESVKRYLSNRTALLVLDNLEHLVDVAEAIIELLDAAPGVKILTTSRIPLHVRAEHVMEVPPLSLPDDGEAPTTESVLRSEAARLFIDRARAVDPEFRLTDRNASAVAEICRRVDGLPLAIELAAARTTLFSPGALVARLSEPLALLKHGPRDVPERHRAMAATIRWSYDLLTPDEQVLFRRTALFEGGARLETIVDMWKAAAGQSEEAVDLVGSLVEKSLLRRGEDAEGDTRVTMLETIREFGLEELEAEGETEPWCQWQASYWLAWVEPGEGYYCTLEEASWMSRLDREHDNLRAAIGWAIEAKEFEIALRLATSLWWYWWSRGSFEEGRRWLQAALAGARDAAPAMRARALFGLGTLASGQGDSSKGIACMEESLAIHRGLEDGHSVAVLVQNLGWAYRERGERERARELFEEALELRRAMDDRRGMALALEGLGGLAAEAADFAQARPMLEQALWLAQEAGDRRRAAHVLLSLGDLARREADEDQAAALYERALERYRALKQPMGIGQALSELADLTRRSGATERARGLYAEALQLYRQTGYARRIASNLIGCAALAAGQGLFGRVARLGGGIDALIESMSVVLEREESDVYDRAMAESRADLGPEEFAREWTSGRQMSTDETITLALQLPTGPAAPRLRRMAGR